MEGTKKRRTKTGNEIMMSDKTLLILVALEKRELHKYGVKTYIEKLTNGQFQLPNSTVYITMDKFERLGLIKRTNENYTKSTYQLTENGKELLKQRTKDVITTLELLKKYRSEDEELDKINLKDITRGGVAYDLNTSDKENKYFLDVIMASHEMAKMFSGVSFSLARKIRFSTKGNNLKTLSELISTGLRENYGYRNVPEIHLDGIIKLFVEMEEDGKDVYIKQGKGTALGNLFHKLSLQILNFTLQNVLLDKRKVDKNIEEINKLTQNIETFLSKFSK